MRYCADTWFLIQLTERHAKALEIVRRCQRGRDRLLVPTLVLAEFRRWCNRIGQPKVAKEIREGLHRMSNAVLVSCDEEVAWQAGELASSFNLPMVDSIVAATSIVHRCHYLLSGDSHFTPLHKQGRLRVKQW